MSVQKLYEKLAVDPFKECDASWQQKAMETLENLISERLTWRQKQIIMLYYYEGRKQREIAAMLGVSESAVSHTKHTALRRLEYYLELMRR